VENEDAPFSLENAWDHLDHLLALTLNLFGGVADIAASLFLRRQTRVEILQWLAPLEAWARRLLLIEALRRPAPNDPPPFAAAATLATEYADKPAPALAENPAQWRVRFNIGLGSASATKPAFTQRRASSISYNAVALAKRLEALRRLIADRERYVQRLARRAHIAPTRTRRAFAPYRHRALCVETALKEAQREVDHALTALNTS
jgi:hypothetical protein